MALFSQICTLIGKDLKIVAQRRWISTAFRAWLLPLAYILFIAYVRTFFLPPSQYGIGEIRPIRNITTEVFNSSTSLGGRKRVAFVNNGFQDGEINDLITSLSGRLEPAGADVYVVASDNDLLDICQSSLAGSSQCYASASFHSSPSEGPGGIWNYTARVDAGLGMSVFVNSANNAAQIYVLPFLHAVDSEIARLSGLELPQEMLEQPFTYQTVQDRDNTVQRYFMRALANYLAVTLFIALCGITFHLPGYLAVEREAGLSSLIDVMSRNSQPLAMVTVRLTSSFVAFVIIYLPAWLAIGAVVSCLIFTATSSAIVIGFHIAFGLSLTAYSLFLGSFFKRAQLSGITALILSLVMAVAAQFVPRTLVAVCVLSALFPPATYTSFAIQLAQWGQELLPANLSMPPPDTTHKALQGYFFFVFLGAQILIYPLLAAIVQLWFHRTSAAKSRHSNIPQYASTSVNLVNVSKTFKGGIGKDSVQAVDGLSLIIPRGQLVSLLGVNGSGKSTLLACLTGTQCFSSGVVELAPDQTIGLCPQANVAWDDLTVFENVKVFSRLKDSRSSSKNELTDLLTRCDIIDKARKRPPALSGGQKRKLQLALAFAGHSTLCCIDEASSGLDPLSRRKIWEILLAERGHRTIIFTTHALDEADALADQVAIMSLGRLIAQGSSAELKDKFGGGYRVILGSDHNLPPAIGGATRSRDRDKDVYTVSDSAEACEVITELERLGKVDVAVRGPDMEDVFLSIASSTTDQGLGSESAMAPRVRTHEIDSTSPDVARMTDLHDQPGKGSGFWRQVYLLFWKRLTVARRNYMPYICALAVPLLTAGLAGDYFLKGFDGIPCSRGAIKNNPETITLAVLDAEYGILVPVGPAGRIPLTSIPAADETYRQSLRLVDNFNGFENYIEQHFRKVDPGGYYLGDNLTASPLMAYRINGNLGYAALAKNLADQFLSGVRIRAAFSTFALPINGSTGDSLQFILYMTLALCAFPAFLTLYPTYERLRNVRALHYSSGVRPAPLWLAYSVFDGITGIIASIGVIVVLTSLSDVFYGPAYLCIAFFLYAWSSMMIAYIVSLFSKTLLSAFAFVAGFQAVSMLLYFVMYLLLLTFGTAELLQHNLIAIQFTYGFISPAGSLFRVMLLSLNQSQLLCHNQSLITYPADIMVYGGPYLCFVLQIIACYAFLVCHDSGKLPKIRQPWKSKETAIDLEKVRGGAGDSVLLEEEHTEVSNDALRVLHAYKRFGRRSQIVTAVDDVTFGVEHGEVLALLGRNGAGKTTTMGLIRGDLKPSEKTSDILISGRSILTDKLGARNHLGVCPQFNSSDLMTVKQHLEFYARIRGVRDVTNSVTLAMKVIGLTPYRKRLTAQLSGGNQRKLHLATAIVGNPKVIILDEPSSGMDAIAMRSMWKAIDDVSKERAVVITTHSMEEASTLANKVAIMDRRLLTIGSPSMLRDRYSKDVYQVHIVHRNGAMASAQDMAEVHRWMLERCPGVQPGGFGAVMHGQMRLRIALDTRSEYSQPNEWKGYYSPRIGAISLTGLLQTLEMSKWYVGVQYYSVSPITLEDVFLEVVATPEDTFGY